MKNYFKQIVTQKINLIIEKISLVILLNTIYSNDFIIFKTGIKIIGQKSLYCANIKAMHAVYIKRIEVKMDCQREWVQALNLNIISRVLHSYFLYIRNATVIQWYQLHRLLFKTYIPVIVLLLNSILIMLLDTISSQVL